MELVPRERFVSAMMRRVRKRLEEELENSLSDQIGWIGYLGAVVIMVPGGASCVRNEVQDVVIGG